MLRTPTRFAVLVAFPYACHEPHRRQLINMPSGADGEHAAGRGQYPIGTGSELHLTNMLMSSILNLYSRLMKPYK